MIYDIDNDLFKSNLTAHTARVNDIEVIDESRFASCSSDKFITVWNMTNYTSIYKISAGSSVKCLKLLPNGYLAAGLNSGQIQIWDLDKALLKNSLIGHTAQVNDLELLLNGDLVSCSNDFLNKIWDLNTITLKSNLTTHGTYVTAVKLISSDLLVSGATGGAICLWNLTTGVCTKYTAAGAVLAVELLGNSFLKFYLFPLEKQSYGLFKLYFLDQYKL